MTDRLPRPGALNETHDPQRRSWVASANVPDTDFPIQNLPLGVFHREGMAPRIGVAIGEQVLDLPQAIARGLLKAEPAIAAAVSASTLNPLMALGNTAASLLRSRLSDWLRKGGPQEASMAKYADELLVPASEIQMMLPAAIGSFTDFLTSMYHTERGGRRSRPDSPLPPNFKHLPVGYNSRATSVRPSGAVVRRPNGQFRNGTGEVKFGPCEELDFELELGMFVGPGNTVGDPVALHDAPDRLFGFCLLNDWSARDIQRWESFPLGPFLSKSLSTTISPWVVTLEAMAPFRAPAFQRAAQDPRPLPYLTDKLDESEGGMDVWLDAFLSTPRQRQAGAPAKRVTHTNFVHMYWTFAQMLTHHTSNGCNLQPGDLLGSGTASGPTDESRACLAELTGQGTTPVDLGEGEHRLFLQDGDEIILKGRARRDGFVDIGFGECRGRIGPAPAWPSVSVN